jgi:hypothetical protein
MAKTKQGRIVVQFPGTPYVIYDLDSKRPRFELYDKTKKITKSKSDNPLDFDKIVFGDDFNAEFSEELETATTRRKRRAKSADK